VVPGSSITYRFDPRAESRLARRIVDDALQRGRVDPIAARDQPVEVVGSRYVDCSCQPARHEHHEHRLWGIGFPGDGARASCSSGSSRRRCASATTCSAICSTGWYSSLSK
jgi:hypothetical protein